jgi:phenylacetate-CoA ligase
VLSIDGRLEDYVILKNGARLGRMDHIFKDLTRIHEAQIVQETPGVICVRVIKTAAYTDRDEQQLLQEFRQRVGDQAEIQIEYPAELERSRTGKLRFVISRIRGGQLQG